MPNPPYLRQMVMLFCIVASGSVTNFFPTVVRTLGYNDVVTLLLTAPPYVLAVIVTYINALHADRTGERYLHIALPLCVAVAAFILAVTTSSLAPRYVAMMLMVSVLPPPTPLSHPYPLLLENLGSAAGRPQTDRQSMLKYQHRSHPYIAGTS